MSRLVDIAQENVERMTALAISQHMASQQQQAVTAGTQECVDCGEFIPERRRIALPYATRCIECQTIVEHRGKHGCKG